MVETISHGDSDAQGSSAKRTPLEILLRRTIEDALAKLPKELHNTYQAFIIDYEVACRRAAATHKEKDCRRRKWLESGIVHHEVFVELLQSGRWCKVIA
jgi:hypothetical protein